MKWDRVRPPNPYDHLLPVAGFEVTSTDVRDAEPMAAQHTSVHGDSLSPQLSWTGAPAGTASFAVTCFDPDAPTPSGFWHWVVIDLPATVTELAQGAGAADTALPGGRHLTNEYGAAGYLGAAPPEGDHPHRYFFVVHAVDVPRLDVDAAARPAVASFHLAFHTLGRALLVPTYQT
ncbi:MAG TPA: YbhB/YbcL family Raf kinase inhibitor-like protein [Candidatus Nanopelagicales bacterium]|jgi:Raf kinase inhibitor-like YbhB/YbcL family protein|nr:YbhB/YbcL family Raf kinase inhibitor-like protein [Candidatus Nanopelagicales bacterium]